MAETLFEELKRYTGWDAEDEAALRELHPIALPHLVRVSETFYRRILDHSEARKALEGGESQVGRLKVTLVAWMDTLLAGPWDEKYFQMRCRIGRVHVKIALPQHYMFGAMNVIRSELQALVDAQAWDPEKRIAVRRALGRILDLELAIMLHTYREDLVEQQERAARLSTFGQLVGSIGHELRNPLGVIESSLYILQGRLAEGDERAKKHVARIGEQLGIANDIVSSLLDMIRDRPLVRERLLLGPVIESAVTSVKHPDGVRIEMAGLNALAVEGDPTQLRQVVVNLVENAIHAAGEQGWVKVEGELTADRVHLSVEDSGQGVHESVRARLFEPLVTTKTKGIGLGLALVKRIVERHGGTISYAPRGAGARFVISLPRSV